MTKTRTSSPDDTIGAIELHGLFGGAICYHYRIESVGNGTTTLARVTARSARNPDGTFSTVYEPS